VTRNLLPTDPEMEEIKARTVGITEARMMRTR